MEIHSGWQRQRSLQPRVGVSACLLGENVRYDGGHKRQPLIGRYLSPWVNLLSFCPEAAAGLGIPRPPVNLVQTSSGIRALGVENSALDVTHALTRTARNFCSGVATGLSAYIVKSRSPSCGAGTTPLYNGSGQAFDTTDGLFVSTLRESKPALLIIDEETLETEAACRHFINQCYDALKGKEKGSVSSPSR